MALTLKELLVAQEKMREKEAQPERISVSQLNELAATTADQLEKASKPSKVEEEKRTEKAPAAKDDRSEKILAELKKHTDILAKSKDDRSEKILAELKKHTDVFTKAFGKTADSKKSKDGSSKDVASELRKHTELLTNLQQKFKNDHSYQILGELKKHTALFESGVSVQTKTDPKDKASYEDTIETRRLMEHQVDLLEKLVENKDEPKETAKKEESGGGLGALFTILAASLGAAVGYIKGYVKILKSVAEAITPDRLIKSITDSFAKITDFFKSIGSFIGDQFEKVKKLFSFGDEGSKIGKIVEGIKTAVSNFFEPIKEGWKMIEEGSAFVKKGLSWVDDMMSGVKTFFESISKFSGSFVKIFKGAMKIFEKLALPLTVIMTIWDTVKGAIEGFEKEGVVGAIKGAISGLINSLIMAPLDMLKSAVSWIVGAFGFEKAEKFLDSFSFEDLFKQFVDAIFSPVETLKNMFDGAVNAIKQIVIPEIGFTIPVIDKQVSIGPFYPFGKAEPPPTPTAPAPTAEPVKRPEMAAKPSANGVQVTPGVPLTKDQMAAVDASIAAGAKPSAEVMKAYEDTKAGTASATTPPQAAANAVYNRSAENAAATTQAPTQVVVSAPTNISNNTSKQNIAMPAPIRNNDAGLGSYIKGSTVFV